MSSRRLVQTPWLTDVITTTNATATTSSNTQYTTVTNTGITVWVRAHARNTSTGNSYTIESVNIIRNVSGTLSFNAAANLVAIGDAAMSGVSISVGASSTTIQVQVTGLASTNIEWLLDVRYWVN